MKEKVRMFRRYSSDLPIDIKLSDAVADKNNYLKDVGLGGLSFVSKQFIEKGKVIEIILPLAYPVFQAFGKVLWCKKEQNGFLVGIEFVGPKDMLKSAAIVQACDIAFYKSQVYEKQGRVISSEEAAAEWLNEYTKKYE